MTNKQENKYKIMYVRDCSPKGFRKIHENLARIIKVQEEIYERKNEQRIKIYEGGLN
ncbi:MAG: hypothetical protein KJ646_04800 [Nanoarchaeota archaeon]|nr:hypothetical protein [Nanoarchaeota archaeon]MBU4116118.1 hypothetical protein [Nanoarchaeota archaeon]